MPAEDQYHSVVIRALNKDGWRIEQEQVPIRVEERRLWIDIQATKANGKTVIFVEVKSMIASSAVEALRDALGQYMLYRAALRYTGVSNITLYLAVPLATYNGILSETLGRLALVEANISLLVVDVDKEAVALWVH